MKPIISFADFEKLDLMVGKVLAEKKMGESVSSGMMLMAVDENNKPTLIKVNPSVKPGTIVR